MLSKTVFWFAAAFLSGSAYYAGYRLTDRYFQLMAVPYPFEKYGAAVGLACFFSVWAILFLIYGAFAGKKRSVK